MTTTLTAGVLSVKITESIKLNGKQQGATNILNISSIKAISKRIVTVTTTEATVLTFGGVMAGGTYVVGDVMYLRFTNLDDTNHIVLTFANGNDEEVALMLDYGQSFIFNADNVAGMVGVLDAAGAALTLDLDNLKSVTADADSDSCDMEMFIASV